MFRKLREALKKQRYRVQSDDVALPEVYTGQVARRPGGGESLRGPKYFGPPYSSLPHPLRREPPRRGGQETAKRP